MGKVLVFKSSANDTIIKLFGELSGQEVYCLIQDSQIEVFRNRFPGIKFINIEKEAFYDVAPSVLEIVSKISFEEVYVTFSGLEGFNYENVLSLVKELHYQKAFFYNANGDRTIIPKDNIFFEKLIRIYLMIGRNKQMNWLV